MKVFAAIGMFLAMAVGRSVAQTVPPVTSDTSYHLNISQKAIKQDHYRASLSVELGPPLPVRVGVSITAGPITLLLRDVRGDVRFHGDLRRLQHLIQSHRSLDHAPAGRQGVL